MTRFMLVRPGDTDAQLVPETPLPLEKDLHDVLTSHPELLPADDLGLGTSVVVGRESNLTSGYADLVLVDDRGQLCLVEVKKEGNPDTRQVVAQLLDYAAGLWGLTLSEFEQRVVAPFLVGAGSDGATHLGEHMAAALADVDGDAAAVAATALERLEQNLAAGDFTLVVAAPEIPDGVQRVLEYLNARGQRFYALEVSYFRGPVECFVPRLVTMPPNSGPGKGPTTPPWEPDALAEALPAHVRPAVRHFLDAAKAAGAALAWQSYGVSIKVTRTKTRQVAYIEPKRLGVTIQASGGFPEEPFAEAARRLRELGVGDPKSWWHVAAWSEVDAEQAEHALDVVLDMIRGLVERVEWTALDAARSVVFERNDHNLWEKQIPALADLHGQRLRGSLAIRGGGAAADVELVPLAGNQHGWLPRFPNGDGEQVWPAGVYQGSYELTVAAVAGGA